MNKLATLSENQLESIGICKRKLNHACETEGTHWLLNAENLLLNFMNSVEEKALNGRRYLEALLADDPRGIKTAPEEGYVRETLGQGIGDNGFKNSVLKEQRLYLQHILRKIAI